MIDIALHIGLDFGWRRPKAKVRMKANEDEEEISRHESERKAYLRTHIVDGCGMPIAAFSFFVFISPSQSAKSTTKQSYEAWNRSFIHSAIQSEGSETEKKG